MRGLNCANIEVDEIWGFIGAKRNRADAAGCYGDVWTFIALDSDSKLIPSFTVGKREASSKIIAWSTPAKLAGNILGPARKPLVWDLDEQWNSVSCKVMK